MIADSDEPETIHSFGMWFQLPGERTFDLQHEVGVVMEAVRHSLDHLDLVADPF